METQCHNPYACARGTPKFPSFYWGQTHQNYRQILCVDQILGRADKAINFIKRGAEEAFTEVTLSAGPGKRPYIIQRTLKKDNMSRYRVNGE